MLVHIVDVDSGNIRSVANAVKAVGFDVELIRNRKEAEAALPTAQRVILPGVGNFGHFMSQFKQRGLVEPVLEYIKSGRPIMGVCVGLQAIFAGSEESVGVEGLDVFNGTITQFDNSTKSVPHMGWNSIKLPGDHEIYGITPASNYYFVHTFARIVDPAEVKTTFPGWDCTLCTYEDQTFVASLSRGKQLFTQFHPEKSGKAGLKVFEAFLKQTAVGPAISSSEVRTSGLTKRIIACLDVRANDQGDIVVTKGDQYDVREKSSTESNVRNLGKPVQVAQKYYQQGADEITFLNITSFRNCPLNDLPMVEILKQTSATVFVPLTIGGGIRDTVDAATGEVVSALEVAHLYFRSGADKVSIGGDAVFAAERYFENGNKGDGTSPIETISKGYGAQAVVVSVDPKKVYVNSASETKNKVISTAFPGPNGETLVWYQCTVKGGREARDIGAYELAVAAEALGAGEILLNSIDKDGSNSGFDLELVALIKSAVKIPVIASSGAGNPEHFRQVFEQTTADAALGAGMFHRDEYSVADVKDYLAQSLNVRL